ncbi:MAG TPA: hypothetical protein VHF92_05370 [Geodermatophilus sp.]|nr:hypothetical protein [Geodermatophilus sp.]
MFMPALVTKIASAGALTKAAAGVGVVLVALAGAAAAPGPVNDALTGVLGTASDAEQTGVEQTGVEETEAEQADGEDGGTGDVVGGGDLTTEGSASDGEPLSEEDADDAGQPVHPDNFGGWVSEQAHEDDGVPGVDGREVSEAARASHQPGYEVPADSEDEADDSVEQEPVDEVEVAQAPTSGGGNGGHGAGQGNGGGRGRN